MARWKIHEKVAYPAYKVSEEEEQTQQHIEQKDIKEAQALTGALLWLSTRTRPDLCQGVAAMSHLVTRNPLKAVQIGQVLLKYVNGNPGGMHFPAGVNAWGKRDQLKAKRHEKLLEIYADIAYATSDGHRSIQGLVVMFAGVPIVWQTTQQPFVTHSTAEAELVSYCEGLLAGRATEALLCAMWGENVTSNSFERVMYGDNAAAIGLAHGTTTSSWRTRHLRIRSSILKEALDEKQAIHGGPWKLIHLKGTELVADGCTKPLNGQAFFRFLEDLSLQRGEAEEEASSKVAPVKEFSNGGSGFAAVKAFVLGSALLSSAKGASDEDEDDAEITPLMVTGAVLMALGAIYAGQVIHSATSYCLRRLRGSESCESLSVRREDSESSDEDDDGVLVVSEDEVTVKRRHCNSSGPTSGQRGKRANCGATGATSMGSKTRSGSGGAECATSMSSREHSGSGSAAGATSMSSRTHSGSGSAAGATSMRSQTHSGSCGVACTASPSMTTQSGMSSYDGDEPRRSGDGGGGSVRASSSLSLTERSGFCSAAGETSSLELRPRSGSQQETAGEPAETCIAAAGSLGRALEESRPHGSQISNKWNLFQHKHRNQGLTSTQLAKMYKDQKSTGAKMP